ncbi:MAG: hypothetical protein EOO39_00585 [Cytophagaceae bacterium]|nr:MAG: hypothetical protein EOO39_00585 [Cytophagaceae bacterium]
MIKKGDLIAVWWSTGKVNKQGQNIATVLEIKPYNGKYKEHFDQEAKLEAPRTKNGYLWMDIEKKPNHNTKSNKPRA